MSQDVAASRGAERPPGAHAHRPAPGYRWLGTDLLLVGSFAVVGRLSHDETLSPAGWWSTAGPFLAGTLLGWGVLRVARLPGGTPGSGAVVWLAALVAGMGLRRLAGDGTATAFVVVAALVLAALLVGSRVVVRLARRRAA
jgi:hypothetical protein